MVLANIKDFRKYESLNPHFKALADYLETHDLLKEDLGRIVLDGDKLFINNNKLEGSTEQFLELHRKYIDVHILLEGKETIGIKDLSKISSFSTIYDNAKDCILSKEKSDTYVNLTPGDFVICFPQDGHAPGLGSGVIRKAIVKVIL